MTIKQKLEVFASKNYVGAKLLDMIMYLSSLRFTGDQYECPICTGNFRKFLSGGNDNNRQNSKCPRCRSLERHRTIWIYIKSKTDILKNKQKILYIAPEYCFRKQFDSLKNIQYISIDLESPLAMKKMDITDLKFAEFEFDGIFCLHVLEHVENDIKAMHEFFRVLKPSGWAILQVPVLREKTYEDKSINTKELRLKHFGQEDHVREYGLDFKERLEESGFFVNVESLQKIISNEQADRYRILFANNEMENIYFCTKPKENNEI